MVEGRICNRCREHKSWESFAINNKGVNDRKSICKSCSNVSQRELAKTRRETNPKLWSDYRREKLLLSKYGITTEIYNQMLSDQHYCCAICRTPENKVVKTNNFYVDHCHATNKVRGLLCYHCNTLLGMAFDKPEILRGAAMYVEHYA